MLRRSFGSRALGFRQNNAITPALTRGISTSVRPSEGQSEEEHREARTWFQTFNVDSIPKNICEVTFSRASGPGGQNVNKVNSKATLRVQSKHLLPLLPKVLHPDILASRFYAGSSDALLIQADSSRKQSDNVQACYEKLHALVVEAARARVKGDTSQARMAKVKSLQKLENETRLRSKKAHSNKKAARKGASSSSDY